MYARSTTHAVSERLDIRAAVGARRCHIHWRSLYHPPRPPYTSQTLLQVCIEEINQNFLDSRIILAGHLNQMSDEKIAERTGLMSIVHQPTRGTNILDRIYVSSYDYSTVRVASTVRSDHGAVAH